MTESTCIEMNELISNTGKSAPAMTTSLKYLGDGDMQKGITNIAEYFKNSCQEKEFEKGIRVGNKKGYIAGVLTTSVVVILTAGAAAVVKYNIDKRKNSEDAEKQLEQNKKEEEKQFFTAATAELLEEICETLSVEGFAESNVEVVTKEDGTAEFHILADEMPEEKFHELEKRFAGV